MGCSEVLTLKGGVTVETALVERLIALENRGLKFSVEPDGRLRVAPPERLTAPDIAFIRAHKAAVLEIVRYCDALPPC